MGDVFVDQPIKLELETYNNVGGASELKILYKKPDGDEGEWAASEDGTKVFVNVTGAMLDVGGGRWYFHASVLYNGAATPVIGERANLYVFDQFEKKRP